MALQESNDAGRTGQHHCRDCGVFFESGKSLEVHLQYHKENLLSKWANQAATQSSHSTGDSENNNVKRREFQTAPADSTVLPTGPGRPSSTTGYTGSSSPFPHPQTPSSYASAPSPYQSDVPSNPGPSPTSTSYSYSNGEPYTFNGYGRPPRSHPGYYPEHPPQEGYSLPPTVPETTPHSPTSSSSFRFFNKPCYPLDKNGVSSSSPNTCEKCGCVCESSAALADHVKTAHPSYGHVSAFQAPETFYKTEPAHDSPDILDLDCQQKFRPQEEESASLPPVSNPHSVSAMLNPWPQSKYPPYHAPPSNPQTFQNGAAAFPPESYSPPNVPNNQAIPSATSPKPASQGSNSSKNESWKSNEARRPKTYNCSACNKWFTSSGHLKRHYNTTLHKNAVKQSGHPDPATLPISSHHHPDRDPSYIHSSKTPPGIPNPPPKLNCSAKPKKAKSMSPQGDMGASSPALSSANEGDSSRSGFNTFDIQPQSVPPPQSPYDNGFVPQPESFEYYRFENRLPQNSTNQISSQTPNYQAGLSVSPSGGLPICLPSPHFQPTLNHMTYIMGENIMTQLESVPQLQVLGQPTTLHYTNSLIITGNESEPLPSFSQLVPEGPYARTYYTVPPACSEFYLKTTNEGGDIMTFKAEPHPEVADQIFIKVEPEEMLGNYDYDEGMLSEPSSVPSPIQVPTSTNIELCATSPAAQPVRRKKKKKKEESSNQVSSTGSPKPAIRCEECDKSFNRICYLTQHNKCFHSGIKPFKCDRCGKRFHSELRVRDHETKHAGVKPYRCEICPKSFNHKTDLRRHLCLHTGQKPYSCSTCGKGFIRKDHMLKHMDTHKNAVRRRYLTNEFEEQQPQHQQLDKAKFRGIVPKSVL